MNLMDSNDQKSELLKRAAQHREDLEDEVKLISERTEKIIINALIVGGSLAATYFLVRKFTGSKKRKGKSKPVKIKIINAKEAAEQDEESETHESSTPGIVSQIGAAIASKASLFLLDLAKEKLSAYMKSPDDKKEKAS